MSEITPEESGHTTISDEEMMRHIAICGVVVTVIAILIATVANTVA